MGNRNEGPIGTLDQVGIDVEDLDRAAQFWSALLGLKVADRVDDYLSFEKQGDGPRLYLQKVPEKKTAKTRAHFDIDVADLDVAVSRAVALGAKKVQSFIRTGHSWVVMEDPDGNEFCLTHGPMWS